MDITVLVIEGCPHRGPAEQNLRAALSRTGQLASVVVRTVATDAEAVRLGFAGSPTILIDGHDPFPAAAPGGLSCRIFTTPDGPKGAPSIDHLATGLGAGAPGLFSVGPLAAVVAIA